MQTNKLQQTLIALSLTGISSASSAATVAYGVFDKVKYNDYTDTIFAISNEDVSQIAKFETIDSISKKTYSRRSYERKFNKNKFKYKRDKYRRNKDRFEDNDESSLELFTDSSSSFEGLTITGSSSNNNKFTSGTWSYSGTDTIDWLAIKYGLNFGLYKITDGDTSGEWDIAELERFSDNDATGAKYHKRGKVKYSAFSHATAYSAITPVPLPAASWLFMSGLLGLVTISRRKLTSKA